MSNTTTKNSANIVSALHFQVRGYGAAHPVLRPVCHAGGDGCIHSSEKGKMKGFMLLSLMNSLYKNTQSDTSPSPCVVDVSADQPVLGRPHQAASGRRWRLALQTQDWYCYNHILWKNCPNISGFAVLTAKNWYLTLFNFDSPCSADLCEKEPFLDTEEGAPFRSVFKYVRLQYIINDLASARILERDNILPPGKFWFCKSSHYNML